MTRPDMSRAIGIHWGRVVMWVDERANWSDYPLRTIGAQAPANQNGRKL